MNFVRGPHRVLIAIGAFFVAGCVASATPVPATMPDAPAAKSDPGFSRPPPGLSDELAQLWKAFPGKTGIAVVRIDGDWELAWRGGDLFPQQSVSKLWVALTAFDQLDQGRIALDDRVKITTNDLTLFSQPIATRVRTAGEINPLLSELIDQAINRSDNTANDSILRHVGGPRAVRDFIGRKRLGSIRFGPGERLLQSEIAGIEWKQEYSSDNGFQKARAELPMDARKAAMDRYLNDPIDGASPLAIARALARLARGELLSEKSTRLMLATLERTRTGPNRLRAGLPAGWRFGNKTGTGQNLEPITAGYNDIGIATAPDGTRYAIVVMLADTTAPVTARMQLMQAVSRAVANGHGK